MKGFVCVLGVQVFWKFYSDAGVTQPAAGAYSKGTNF